MPCNLKVPPSLPSHLHLKECHLHKLVARKQLSWEMQCIKWQRTALPAWGITLLMSEQKHAEGEMKRLPALTIQGTSCSCKPERKRNSVRPIWPSRGNGRPVNGEQVFALLFLLFFWPRQDLKGRQGEKTKNMGSREWRSLLQSYYE